MVSRLMILMSTCVLTFCSFNEISTVGCGWRLRRMRRHSHVLIATPHVSDQSLLLVAHRGERLSCFARRCHRQHRGAAMRFGCLSVVPQRAGAHDLFGFTSGAGRLFECSWGARGATASPTGAAAADIQVVRRTFACLRRGRHRLQRWSLL